LTNKGHVSGRFDTLQRGDAGVPRGGDGRGLVARELQHFLRRTDERDTGGLARFCQIRVLRQESVAGVHRIGAGCHGNRDDRLRIEVRADWVPALSDLVRFISTDPMLRPAVLIGEHCHGLDTQLVRGANGSDGDFATVGHKNLLEQRIVLALETFSDGTGAPPIKSSLFWRREVRLGGSGADQIARHPLHCETCAGVFPGEPGSAMRVKRGGRSKLPDTAGRKGVDPHLRARPRSVCGDNDPKDGRSPSMVRLRSPW
jgi:hypothetical protein